MGKKTVTGCLNLREREDLKEKGKVPKLRSSGPEPCPHQSSRVGGREMEQGENKSPGLLNTQPCRTPPGA